MPLVRHSVSGLALAALLAACGGSAPAGPAPATVTLGSSTAGPSTPGSTPTSTSPSSALSIPVTSQPAGSVTTTTTPPPAAVTPTSTALPDERTPAAPNSASPPFEASIEVIDDALAARMSSSWRPGCPVALADLRYVTVSYRGFDDDQHTGELVVAASVADDVVTVMADLYEGGYPIRSMRLVDVFGGSDDDSMTADNTSAFNCRPVTGGSGWSEHAYGAAIDLNPVENPYLSGSTVLPAAGAGYLDRGDGLGVIHDGDTVVQAFAGIGWSWGGDWPGPIDYQHFSLSGR